eukprot:2273032-Alexandrium_andersonii.AAC.1
MCIRDSSIGMPQGFSGCILRHDWGLKPEAMGIHQGLNEDCTRNKHMIMGVALGLQRVLY